MEHNNKTISRNITQVVADIKQIIDTGRNTAYAAVDSTMITTYWNIGRRIVEEEQHGQERAIRHGTDKNIGKRINTAIWKRLQSTISSLLPKVLSNNA